MFRAIDAEKLRQGKIKREFEMVAKAALVNNIKVKRKKANYSPIFK